MMEYIENFNKNNSEGINLKIDLHLHTKRIKSGDSPKRNITPEKFVKTLKENEVVVSAITNHNHFDMDEYNEIINHDPDLVVFPGIELDVKNNENHHHIIVICNPNIKKDFKNTFDGDSNRDYDSYYLKYDEFIEKIKQFNNKDIIIIPHFLDKDKKRALNKKSKEDLKSSLKEYLVILEPGKLHTMGIINAHNELSLTGSDVTDWSQYNINNVPDIKFKISSFSRFYELATETTTFISQYLKNTDQKYIETAVHHQKLKNKLSIYKDINIIFGEKGSGKTKLLRTYIHPFFHEQNSKVFLHEGKDYDKKYTELISNYKKSVTPNEEIVNAIHRELEFILNYKEEPIANVVEQLKIYYSNSRANRNAKILKKKEAKFSNTSVKKFPEILQNLQNDIGKIIAVETLNKKAREEHSREKLSLTRELFKLSNDVNENAINTYKNVFINEKTESLLDNIKSSVQKKTGEESKPGEIGFAKLVSSRLNRVQKNISLIKNLENIREQKIHKLGYIPNKGDAYIKVSIELLGKDEQYPDRKLFNRITIVNNRNIMRKIYDFSFDDFKNINEYYTLDEKTIDPSSFLKDTLSKDSYIAINGNDSYTPSEGEKAIITISGLLEDETYDAYLFDEIERGLGQKYITDYVIPKLKELRDKGKYIIVATHNSNIAINTLPSQTVFCDYKTDTNNIYYAGNMYSNKLLGLDSEDLLDWQSKALMHLEGSEEMFNRRRNIYGNEK